MEANPPPLAEAVAALSLPSTRWCETADLLLAWEDLMAAASFAPCIEKRRIERGRLAGSAGLTSATASGFALTATGLATIGDVWAPGVVNSEAVFIPPWAEGPSALCPFDWNSPSIGWL